jgi:tRNA pseudouridine13 synthase
VDLPYLTADLPGTGGVLRTHHEDFRVDEIPLYTPCGEGEHVYLRVWKRGIATFELARRLAQALEVPERRVAYAGLKDARAVTTQWLSVEGVDEERVRDIAIPKASVLEVRRHGNKLKLGHLRGNRFQIIVREAGPGAPERASAVLETLVSRGAPNYFGEQRFGARLNGHLLGEAILRGDHERFVRLLLGGPSELERDPLLTEARRLYEQGSTREAYDVLPTRYRSEKKALHALLRFGEAERAFFAIPMRMRQMFLSSFQSHLFNRVVTERLPALDRMAAGDLAYLHRNGAVFAVEDVEEAQVRCRALEISPSAPIYGTRNPMATGKPGEVEERILAESGVTREDFEVSGGLRARGRRRSMRLPLAETALEPLDETSFRVSFSLPAGSFATSVMREICKTVAALP